MEFAIFPSGCGYTAILYRIRMSHGHRHISLCNIGIITSAQQQQLGLNARVISAFALAGTAVGAAVKHNDVILYLGRFTYHRLLQFYGF